MPQTGTDLVSAGYPISRPLLALLGGSSNLSQTNVPVRTNLDFVGGVLVDTAGAASGGSGSVRTVAVPVSPGDVITKINWVVGSNGTGAACATAVTNAWSALYTGSGGSVPALMAQTASLSGASVPTGTLYTFTFSTPQQITAINAPFGYVYASFSTTIGAASPNNTEPSLISMTVASAAQYPWYTNSPIGWYFVSNGGAGSAAPATLSFTGSPRTANPPVVFLT